MKNLILAILLSAGVIIATVCLIVLIMGIFACLCNIIDIIAIVVEAIIIGLALLLIVAIIILLLLNGEDVEKIKNKIEDIKEDS